MKRKAIYFLMSVAYWTIAIVLLIIVGLVLA